MRRVMRCVWCMHWRALRRNGDRGRHLPLKGEDCENDDVLTIQGSRLTELVGPGPFASCCGARSPPPLRGLLPAQVVPTERSVLCRGWLPADCSCISGGLRPPDTPCFPGRTPSSPGPSGRGTTRFAPYVPLDPLCGPGAYARWFAGFDGWCLVPGRLAGLDIDGLGGQRIDGLVPDSSLCSLALTLRTTRSRLTEHVGTTVLGP